VSVALASPDVTATTPVYGQTVNVNATVTPVSTPILTIANNPTGTLTYKVGVTTTTAGFTIPLVLSTPTTITVTSESSLVIGQTLYITDGAHPIEAPPT